MTQRAPLVFGDDGLIQQLQSGDNLRGQALAYLLAQNDLILKMLTPIYLQNIEQYGDLAMTDGDIEAVLGEL